MFKTLIAALGFLGLAGAHIVPPKISLQSRVAFPVRSLKQRALSPATVPLADFFLGTDLQWFGNLTVGTPPQNVPVVFDTGSSTLEFASTLCASCSSPVLFDPNQSSTFRDEGKVQNISFSTGVGVDPVVGDDYRLTLRSAVDTVSVEGLTAPNTSLFLITDQTPLFNIDPFSGIQGMSARAQGFFLSLVDQGLPSLFSMYLTPQMVGNAELTLGGVDCTKFTGKLPFKPCPFKIQTIALGTPRYASLASHNSHWSLTSPGLSVNGKTNPILTKSRNIIFDSGTSNVLFSTDTAEAIYALISPDIKPNPCEPGTYGIACNKISSLPAVIDITFTSQNGEPFNLTIPSSELSVGPFNNDPSTCQTLINAFDGLELVGGSLLKHWYSIWDIQNQRLGFAPAKL